MKVLIVEDDVLAAKRHATALTQAGYADQVYATNADEALAVIRGDAGGQIGLALIDWHLPGAEDGSRLVRQIRALTGHSEHPYTIIISAELHHYTEALAVGANDFLQKPLLDHLLRASLNLMRRKADERQVAEQMLDVCSKVFESDFYVAEGLESVVKKVLRAAPSDATVLITGSTGVGKEAIAGAIHRLSRRANTGEFVTVNCATIPEDTAESVLFGHEKGGFTGAMRQHIGLFERAHRGTLFLDEIADLPLDIQAKILRVIEYGDFQRLGGEETLKTDVRLIVATWQSLEERVKGGTFRADLYYRLKIIPIDVPSLSDRRSIIPRLANSLYQQLRQKHGQTAKLESDHLTEETIAYLQRRDWQGSVRELRSAIEAAVILSDGPTLTPVDFGAEADAARADAPPPVPWEGGDPPLPCNFDLELDRYAAAMIRAAMRQGGSTFAGAAKLLKGFDNQGRECDLKENKIAFQYKRLRQMNLLEALHAKDA
jgi:DNA-binding NtrC family response regulator